MGHSIGNVVNALHHLDFMVFELLLVLLDHHLKLGLWLAIIFFRLVVFHLMYDLIQESEGTLHLLDVCFNDLLLLDILLQSVVPLLEIL
jgi:hypothetical protein